jgi:RNA ligase (TIGR02306 family)
MSNFSVNVLRIASVENHPDADRLSINAVLGYCAISNKLEDGSHRYKAGDLIVYIPEGAVVPEWILKPGFWDEKKNKGILAGSKGDRVKSIRLRGIFSTGILFPLNADQKTVSNQTDTLEVAEGDDVSGFLGIFKYEPVIPMGMSGEVCNVAEAPHSYDFESIQRLPDLFDAGEIVEASEKIHGSCFQFGYIPGLNHEELFFDGNVYCASKGLGAKGLVFKNNAANDANLYVRSLRKMLDDDLGEILKDICDAGKLPIRIWGEVFGQGVQDLHYGQTGVAVRIFDIKLGNEFVSRENFQSLAKQLKLETVPVLYTGPYDLPALEAVRDGKDAISGTNVREGIVIRSLVEGRHPYHGRKIGKFVSPDYLLRKGNVTEFA